MVCSHHSFSFSANCAKYTYDMANRLGSRAYPDSLNDTFAYDADSRLTFAASGRYNNNVVRTYDTASRLMSETQNIGGTAYVVGYGYDAASRQTAVTYPDASVVARTFTDRNQLASVTLGGNAVANFAYDDGMRKSTATFGNGAVETRAYRTDNLVSQIATPNVTTFDYTWDANKRKTGQTETGIPTNNQTFGYDNEDRLASFNRNNGDAQAWGLSLVGDWNTFTANGTLQSRQHNSVHETQQVDATPLTYDLKGNLLTNSNGQVYT